MAGFENFALPQVELTSQQVFYSIKQQFRSNKKHRHDQLPENVLLIYPRYFESQLGLTFLQILTCHREGISINFGEMSTRIHVSNITGNHAMRYINDDNMVKYWLTKEFYVRLSDYDQWAIVQVPTGELLLFIKYEAPDEDIIEFTRQTLLYPNNYLMY